MRWIDIWLNRHDYPDAVANLLGQAADGWAELPALQRSAGLDSPAVIDQMAKVGQFLFRAVTRADAEAFSIQADNGGAADPEVGFSETDHLIGFHLIVAEEDLGLPWNWLHNGIGFLLERHPICASLDESRLPNQHPLRPWMKRYHEALLSQGVWGERPLRQILAKLRPRECADPEILFVPGHCESRIRRLIYREADGIRRALAASNFDRPLARLTILEQAITPGMLARRGPIYQGLHFAGPTSRPLDHSSAPESAALSETADAASPENGVASGETGAADDLEVVGVDPITVLLDTVSDHAASGAHRFTPKSGTATAVKTPWLLDDGPVQPEQLGRESGIPPLVFSNSFCSIPELGSRFLASGVSTFVGPVAALYSRPARKFAGRFYNFLGDGYSAGSALRTAALACRSQFGEHHPVWLSYGLIGYGSLALQYL